MSEPKYLVQTADGMIHGYWNVDILQADLMLNKNEPVHVYELIPGIKVRYMPIERFEIEGRIDK